MHKSTNYILYIFCGLFFISPVSRGEPLFIPDGFKGDNPVTFNIQCVDGEHGEQVCIQFFVDGFEDIAGLQFAIRFDPTVLEYVNVQNEALSGTTAFLQGPNELRYLWTEAMANGITLPDGTLFMELCFDIIGPPGSVSPIEIIDLNIFPIEFSDSNSQLVEVLINPCQVTVLNSTSLAAIVSSCGADGGLGDGTFTITVFGGTGPYTVDWVHTTMPAINGSVMVNAPGDSETVNSVAGTYDITVTDDTGAEYLLTTTIESVSFITSITGFNPTCFDFTNGRISIDATEGQAPYGFIWKHATNTNYHGSGFIFFEGGSNIIPSLPSGPYYLTITDNLGCEHLDTVNLGAAPFMIQETITDATCEGSMDGRVDFLFSGATPIQPGNLYDITWQNNSVTANSLSAVLLNPGTYSLTITDDRGCDSVHTFIIGSTTEITGTIVTTDASCQGNDDGEVMITGLTNGVTVGPYDFAVLDGNDNPVTGGMTTATTLTVTGLSPGDYYTLISEDPCISDTLFFTINESDPVGIQLVNIKANSCLAVNDGRIEVEGIGGTIGVGSDYQYDWTGGLSGALVTGLANGNYTVTVTDDNGCTATMSYTIVQAQGPQIDSIVAENISCTGSPTAELTVYFTPGSAPVTNINWDNGGTTATITGLTPGPYTVTIRDSLFCFDIDTYIVPGEGAMEIDSLVVEEPSCAGLSDGQITVYASGAAEPYTYIWSTMDTVQFNLLPGLSAGTFTVTVVDSEDCSTVDTTITINDPAGLSLQFSGIDTVSCPESCDGIATITPSGGIPGVDYDFVWESGFMETGQTSTAIDLCAGFQSVTVTQDGMCFFVDSVMVPAPESISAGPDITDVSCYGESDGEVSLNLTGGHPGYTVQWMTLPDGEDQSGLSTGIYYYTATDVNGCTYMDSVVIGQPDSLSATLDTVLFMPLSCGGTDDGVIALEVNGGTPDYDFLWTPDVSQTEMAGGLGPGDYSIVVSDDRGCTDTVEVTLQAPEAVTAFFPEITAPECAGDLTFLTVDSAIGGNGPYFFTVNSAGHYPIGEQVPVPAGLYVVSVQDDSGCATDSTFMIEDPAPIEFHVEPLNPIVKLGDTLALHIVFDHLNHPVAQVSWSNNGQLSCYDCTDPVASLVEPTTFTVTVTDTAGCVQTLEVFVDVDDRRFVYIPNIFSPNRDGINDEFRIFTGFGVDRVNNFRIFDRWGQLVYERFDLLPNNGIGSEGWDGTRNGEQMLPGVYVYVAEVEFADGKVVIYRGDVTLVR